MQTKFGIKGNMMVFHQTFALKLVPMYIGRLGMVKLI